MYLPITTLSICAIGLLLVVLSLRVINVRRGEKVSLGDGGNDILERRIRAQGNLTEYGPIGLILILVAELQMENLFLLGAAAAAFVMGRILHGYALSFTEKAMRARITGMMLTLFSLLALVAINLWQLVTAG